MHTLNELIKNPELRRKTLGTYTLDALEEVDFEENDSPYKEFGGADNYYEKIGELVDNSQIHHPGIRRG